MLVSFIAGSALFATDFSSKSNDELVNLAGDVAKDELSSYISEIENRVSKMSDDEVNEVRNKLVAKEKQIVIALNDNEKANYKKDIEEALQTKATSSRSIIKDGTNSLEESGEDLVKKGESALKKGAKKTKNAVESGVKKGESAIEKGVEKGESAIKKGAKSIKNSAGKTKSAIEKGVTKGADKATKAVQKGIEKLEGAE